MPDDRGSGKRGARTVLLAVQAMHALTALTALPPYRLTAQEHRHEAGAPAQERVRHNPHLLVTAEWLAARRDSNVVVVHVGRTDSAYLRGHIPGARFLSVSAVAVTIGGVPSEFPPAEEIARSFQQLVIPEGTRIVLYGDDAGLLAARAWVALDVMGHGDRAALLDGSLTRWRALGHALDTGRIALPAVVYPFPVRWQAQRLVDAAWVRARLGDSTVLFVDARPAAQYDGQEPPCAPGATGCVQIPEHRRGHIPGAVSLFWMRALAGPQDPTVRSMHQLHHELWEPAGADRPHVRTIVTYCRTGFQSSHAYWQARYIGYPDVRMYDGSFIEWSGRDPAMHPVAR